MIEIWITTKESEQHEVSNMGNLRRKNATYQRIHKGKLITSPINNKIVGSKLSKKGYNRVNMAGTTYQVHRIVANAFIDNPNNLEQVNHINGIKTDNRVSNLEWVTNQQNRDHAVSTGLQAIGSRLSKKLTEDDVTEIRRLSNTMSQKEIANIYNVIQQTISCICLRKTWKHI